MIPLQGYSMLNREGKPLYDEESNAAFAKTMQDELSSDVELLKVDTHINDPEFADEVVTTFKRLREIAHQSE